MLESFDIVSKQNSTIITRKDIKSFRDIWAKYDPEGKGIIQGKLLYKIIMNLELPLGLPNFARTRKNANLLIGKLEIPIYRSKDLKDKTIYFNYFDTLFALSRNALIIRGGRNYKE